MKYNETSLWLQRGQRLGERGELPNFGSSDQMASNAVPSDAPCLWFLNRDLKQRESIANSEICKMKNRLNSTHLGRRVLSSEPFAHTVHTMSNPYQQGSL